MEKQFSNTLADKRALDDFMGFLQGNSVPNPDIQIPLRPKEEIVPTPSVEPVQEPVNQEAPVVVPETQSINNPVQAVSPTTTSVNTADNNVNNRLQQYIKSLNASKVTPNTKLYDDLAAQMEQANQDNKTMLTEARGADERTRLINNIAKIGGQLNEAFANRAGNTNIKVNPLQFESPAISQAQEDSKTKLAQLAQKYQMMQAKDKSLTDAQSTNANLDLKAAGLMLDQAKAEQDRALKLELADKVAKAKSTSGEELGFKEKEEFKQNLKDTSVEKKENRKVRQDITKVLPGLDDNLSKINKAIALLEKGKVSTGPIDARMPTLSKDSQAFENLINSISLNKMVSMFSGMSKAVDSEGERAKFESTVPSMSTYETENLRQLKELKQATEGLIKKSKDAASKFDRSGNWVDEESTMNSTQESSSQTSSVGPYGAEVERNGKMYVWDSTTNKYRPRE